MTNENLSEEMLAHAERLCRAARERGHEIFSGYDEKRNAARNLHYAAPEGRENFGRTDEDGEPGAER